MTYPSTATIKRLFAVSGNQCAFQDCLQTLVEPTSGKVVGEICHIKAQSAGGPRFDSTQSDTDRHGFSNLIAMCPMHHQVIDSDTSQYTVERLIEIKQFHEQKSNKVNEPSDDVANTLINKILATISPQQKNLDYFEQLIETGHWNQKSIAGKQLWICVEDNMCQIEVSDEGRDFHEPWTDVYPDSVNCWAYPIYLKVNNVLIEELTFVSCDGGRIAVPMPEIDMRGEERIFYWNKNSLPFKLSKILGDYYIYGDIWGIAKQSTIEIR